MSASKAASNSLSGDLAVTSVPDVLSMLEAQMCDARVRFETEMGSAEVELRGGRIVQARLAELDGKSALFRLLGVVDGSFEVTYEPIAERPPLGSSVAQLVEERAQRFIAWRKLSERAPSPWAVLELTEVGRAECSSGGNSEEARVLGLVNGQRTLTDIIGQSPFDAVDVLTRVVQGIERGAIAVVGQPARESRAVEPVAAKEGMLEVRHPAGRRKNTEVGLGNLELVGSSTTEIRRIISIGGSSTSVPPTPGSSVLSLPSAESLVPQESGEVPSARALEPQEFEVQRRSRFVGRYELLCPIGRGGMGSVYLGRLTSEGGFRRLFAVKLLRRHLLEDSAAAQRFLEEARLAGHIHHPNVVSVLDAGFHGSQPYLVMDYIEGASFKQLLSIHPHSRSPERILPIVLEALAGLHAAHTLVDDDGAPIGLVHCDVSPENLLVGADGVCRLLDFGVARSATAPRERETVTRGKPGYLAPEQILGAPVDARTDVFAMGIVLYNAITGTRLFEAPTVEETMREVCIRRIEPPSTVGLRPTPALDFVCMRALDREPSRRFSSAEEMMIELRRVALREGLLASSTDIASWVRDSVGAELAQRRLHVLESRKSAVPAEPQVAGVYFELPHPGEAPAQNNMAIVLHASARRDRVASDDPPIEEDGEPRTRALPADKRRLALIAASALALFAVILTLLWPDLVSSVFRLETERVNVPSTYRVEPSGTNLAPE